MPGRHLVEQRLEQVVVGAVDDGDVDVRVRQRADHVEPAEPAADHHDPVPSARLGASSVIASSCIGYRRGARRRRPSAPAVPLEIAPRTSWNARSARISAIAKWRWAPVSSPRNSVSVISVTVLLPLGDQLAHLVEAAALAAGDGRRPPRAVAERRAVPGQHQLGLQRRDPLQRVQVGAHRVAFEPALERDRRRHDLQQVIARAEHAGRRPTRGRRARASGPGCARPPSCGRPRRSVSPPVSSRSGGRDRGHHRQPVQQALGRCSVSSGPYSPWSASISMRRSTASSGSSYLARSSRPASCSHSSPPLRRDHLARRCRSGRCGRA